MIKKYAIILILPLMVPFLSGFSFSQFTDPLYENVKQQAVQSFSDLFSNKVEIGSAGGRLIGQIILNDVKIGNDIKAKKIVINFSPIKYAMAKGDVVPAITSIKVFNGNANIVRGKKGDINAVHFLKPAKPGGGGIPFKANLFLYDCQAEYRDEAGLPYRLKDSLFKTQFENIHGGVDLSRAPQISIDLKASSGKNSIFIKGKANPDKNSFDIRLISKDMDMGSWAPYLLPFIDIHKGTGDLVFNLKNNDINMQLSGKADDVPFTVSGRLFDRLDLNIDVKDADLLKLKNIYSGTSALDLKGRGGLGLHLFGPYNDFKAEIKAKIGAGEIYGQKISGAVSAVYYKKKAAIEAAKISAYDGNILISGEVDFSSKVPHFKLTGNLDSLDLKKLSDGSPVISGRLSGRMEAGGTFDALYGEYNGKFLHASVMGQPIDFGQLKFRYGEGKFSIDSLSVTSLTAGFNGSGDISKERNVSFSGSASGINLAGEGPLGNMSAKLDSFRGAVSFKFDDAFIKSPLKNLNASGTLEISLAKIGEQTIDRAIGGIALAQGRMKILNASISSGRSTVLISGETGVGVPTDLKISGNALQFDDFKIFNSILPQEINNPTGSIDLDLKIYGTLNKIESADDFLGLNARGSLRTRNGSLGGIYFKEALLEASLENKELNINKIKLATTNSEITGRYLAANGSIEANLAGWFDLDDFSQVLKRIGIFKGFGKLSVSLKGSRARPQGQVSASLKNIQYNDIGINSLDGGFEIKGKKLSISHPIVISSGPNRIKINGAAILADDLMNSELGMNVELEKGEVSSLVDTGIKIYFETARISKAITSSTARIDRNALFLSPPPFKNDFYLDNKKDYYLKYYEKISSEVTAYENKLEKPAFEKIGGSATARLDIRGTINKPKLELQGEIKNPLYGRYLFDSVSVKAQYSEGSLSIKDLSLNNEGARAAFWGYADLEGRLDLKAQARNYSLDFLKIFIDKPFNGWLNLDGGIGGTFTAPTLSISFEGSRGDIGGIGFDKLSGKIFYDGETGYFKDMKLVEGKDISKGDAYFDLKGNGWAKATIEGEAIGFAGLMTNEIEWQSAKSHGEISLLMDNWKPKLYGYLYVTDALFFVKRLNAYMMTGYLDLVADGNDIKVKQLSGSWYNGNQPNSFSVSGAVELNSLNMNWLIADSHFSVDMPSIYKGELDLRGVSLSGRPSNMLLKGSLDFNDGAMLLPKTGLGAAGTQPAAGSPKLKLNLLINLKKNVYLSAGDILTLDLSNIFLNLEMAGRDLKVTGDMSDPKLLGKIVFGRGTVNILSREFNLLSEDNQKKYYPYDLDRISENYAQFMGDGVMPYLRLSALVKVETQDEKDPTKRKEISIVSNIIGQLQAKEESKKLNIAFNAFQEDKTKTPPELVPIPSSDQDIRFMLLPDFIKSLAGNESGPASTPNALVADYLNSRLQSVVFRGVERGIERALGLENLTLEYNFGSDIKRAMGVGGDSRTGQNAGFGVGLTKGFFDKLYIDVRYSQGMEQQAGVQQSTYLNYQITYKLSSIWSIAYYREPASFYDLNSGIYKTTLKLGFSF